MSPQFSNFPSATAKSRARQLVLKFGWNATSYQILGGEMRLWFSARHEAVLGFVRCCGVRVVAGAPICALSALPDVLREWEHEAARHNERLCFFGAAERLFTLLKDDSRYSAVVVGAQPTWHPRQFVAHCEANKSLRTQLARARNKGVVVREWSGADASDCRALETIYRQWLQSRGLPRLRFLAGWPGFHELGDRRIFVAERAGKPMAFTILAPIACRAGFLTEQFVRAPGAPNGAMEWLLCETMRQLASEGARYVSLGMVPLAQPEKWGATETDFRLQNPFWLRFLRGWLRCHARRFYDFEGLERFKTKFAPEFWEPVYVISQEPRFSVQTLGAVVRAFTGRSAAIAFLLGIRRALRHETRWLLSHKAFCRPKVCAKPKSSP